MISLSSVENITDKQNIGLIIQPKASAPTYNLNIKFACIVALSYPLSFLVIN